MPFETIERVGPAPAAPAVPANGLQVSCRAMKSRSRTDAEPTRWITIRIGADLARAAGYHQASQPVDLAIGTGNDAGKIAVLLNQRGTFTAKGKPGKNYAITINAASAEGLFALEFESFTRAPIEVIRPENGSAKFFTFMGTDQLFAADD